MVRVILLVWVIITSQTNIVSQDYGILTYGAIADGKSLSTTGIQSAIDAAHANGGGRVVIPTGRFLTGSLELKSNVELHLQEGAYLLGSTDPIEYTKVKRWWALIKASGQNNISITGLGVIDGQGRKLAQNLDSMFHAGQIDSSQYNFIEKRPRYSLRPQLIVIVDSKFIEIKNVTIRNSACWVQMYDKCENLNIDSVKIDSDAYWNNDGIDISDCHNVRITNCIINSSDDGICLKSHSREHFCDSIYISNCTIRSSSNAIKLGARSYGGFRNVVIENIKVYDTFRSAIAIETVDGGIIENIVVNNVVAINTGNAIFIRLGRRNIEGDVAIMRDVTLKNIKVDVAFKRPDYKYEIRGPALPFFHNTFPVVISGIPEQPIENLRLDNIHIDYPGRGNSGLAYIPLSRLADVPEKISDYPEFSMFGELPAWGFYARHVSGLYMSNTKLSIAAADYRPALVFDDVHNLNIEVLDIQGEDKVKHIVLHKTENVKIDDDRGVLIIQ